MMPSSARVLAHRRVELVDSLDYFPTPPWATRAVFEHVLGRRGFRDLTVDDPCCGQGHMTYALQDYFGAVRGSDIFDYGIGAEVRNFLAPGMWRLNETPPDWIFANPPFGAKALPFLLKALRVATKGVAAFVRTQFLENPGRLRRLYGVHPPELIAQFAERVPLHKGRWEPAGDTMTAYCWIIWRTDRRTTKTEFVWIPPSRQKLLFQRDVDHFKDFEQYRFEEAVE